MHAGQRRCPSRRYAPYPGRRRHGRGAHRRPGPVLTVDDRRTVVSGMKPGRPHIGNYLGLIEPLQRLSEEGGCFAFVADTHPASTGTSTEPSATQVREAAAALLACGLTPDRCVLYRRSAVPAVFQVAWLLACGVGVASLPAATAENHSSVAQLTYPLMIAADIVAVRGTHVPVGPDQAADLEVVRRLIGEVNRRHGANLPVPTTQSARNELLLVGSDGRKMSKSLSNAVPFLAAPDELRAALVAMVAEDSHGHPSGVSSLRAIVAALDDRSPPASDAAELVDLAQELIELRFAQQRHRFCELVSDPGAVDAVLAEGAERASERALRVVEQLGASLWP